MLKLGPREKWAQGSGLGKPGQIDARSRAFWLRWVRPAVWLAFRPEFEGAEHLPSARPFMLVANHSGMGNAEILVLVIFLLERLGTIGPIAPMVHPISYNAWPNGGWMKRLGAIPSTYEAATAALTSGIPVLVMPGGDHEAQRPIWQASQVDFAGRKGFLKIARVAQVPIVPMGIQGSHFTAPVLWRSDHLLPWLLIGPRLLGLKRYALSLMGLIGVVAVFAWRPAGSLALSVLLAWLWLLLPFATLPWVPWKIRVRIGTPLTPEELFGHDPRASLDEAYRRVQSAVRSLVGGR